MQVIIPSGHSNYADFVVPAARFHAAIAAEWACPQRCQVRPPPPPPPPPARLLWLLWLYAADHADGVAACLPASKDCGVEAQ